MKGRKTEEKKKGKGGKEGQRKFSAILATIFKSPTKMVTYQMEHRTPIARHPIARDATERRLRNLDLPTRQASWQHVLTELPKRAGCSERQRRAIIETFLARLKQLPAVRRGALARPLRENHFARHERGTAERDESQK